MYLQSRDRDFWRWVTCNCVLHALRKTVLRLGARRFGARRSCFHRFLERFSQQAKRFVGAAKGKSFAAATSAASCTQRKSLKREAGKSGKDLNAEAFLTGSHQTRVARRAGIFTHRSALFGEGGNLHMCLCTSGCREGGW